MPIGTDSFELYRRNRHVMKLETELRKRADETRQEIVRHIAREEEAEEIEKRVVTEMREFFRDSTRLAAKALSEIHERRSDEVETQLEREIASFFDETKTRALNALMKLKQGAVGADKEMEALFEERVQRISRTAAITS